MRSGNFNGVIRSGKRLNIICFLANELVKGVIRSGKLLNIICFLANELDRKKLTLQYTDAVKLFSYIHLSMYIIGLAVLHSGIN